MSRSSGLALGMVFAAQLACADGSVPTDTPCAFPSAPVVLLEDDGAVLKRWSFPARESLYGLALPPDSGLLAYRAAIAAAGADVRLPPLQVPPTQSEAEAAMWADEQYNNDLAYRGEVGSIGPIGCLDALLFAEQNARVSQLDQPTEFLASVLRRGAPGSEELTIVFGAGTETFVPRSAYGFEIVDEYVAQGWTYWYALHNHTLQRSDGSSTLGVPVPSTSDVQLARNLAEDRGLESVRVTNGFYTFDATVDELSAFRAR